MTRAQCQHKVFPVGACLVAASLFVAGCAGSKHAQRRKVSGAELAEQRQAALLVASVKLKQGGQVPAVTATPVASTTAAATPAGPSAIPAAPSAPVQPDAKAPIPASVASATPPALKAPALVATATAPLPTAVTAMATPSSVSDAAPISVASAPAAPSTEQAVPKVPESTSTSPELYTLQPEDELLITVYQEPDLTSKPRVSSVYDIMVPLVGRVSVAGLTVAQLQDRLTQLYGADYLVNPQVQVSVDTYHTRNVFVTGAVKKPGSYAIPIEKPMTVMEILTLAGGFSEQAATNSVRVIRHENGVEQTIEVRAGDIVKRGDKTKDVAVRPNDIVFVPESFF